MTNFKILNTQISIFFSDGIMNPSKYIKVLNNIFNNVFTNEILSLNIPGVPDDMPLVRYSSKSDDYSYDFARKRLNFYLSFKSFGGEKELDEYLTKIKLFIDNNLSVVTGISRIGIACVYYLDEKDEDISYWSKKYKFPFVTKNVSEISYTINNPFEEEGLNFNNIITLTNGRLKNSKVVPVVSVDINNTEVSNLSNEQIDYIMNIMDCYKLERLCEMFDNNGK